MQASEKRMRLLEAAVAVLQGTGNGKLNIVVLNKALFYGDLCYLRDRGRTITGNSYIALQYGPVVANYPRRLVAALKKERWASQEANSDSNSKPVVLEDREHQFVALDATEVKLLRLMGKRFALTNSSDVSYYSHDNPAWQAAWEQGGKQGGRPLPINMRVALQQVIDRDPWLDSPADGDLNDAFDEAEQGENEEW